MVCKVIFCSDILDKADRKTRRRKTQAIAKRYTLHANSIKLTFSLESKFCDRKESSVTKYYRIRSKLTAF